MSEGASPTPAATQQRRALMNVAAMVTLLCIVVVLYLPTFASWAVLVPAGGGLLLGTAIAVLGAWRRLGVLPVAAITVAAFFAFGGALALPQTTLMGIPTLRTLTELAVGVVTSWKRLLTAPVPALLTDGHGLVPFLVLLLASVLACSLALRLRQAAWALVPVTAALVLTGALGVSHTLVPNVLGALFAAVAVAWLAAKHSLDPSKHLVRRHGDTTEAVRSGARTRRRVTGTGVVALAASVGLLTGAGIVPANDRAVLRDIVTRPLELHAAVSPLQSFRHYVRDKVGEAQFTLSGMPADARVRLATLDAYTGTVLEVAGLEGSSSGVFAPLHAEMPTPEEGEPASITVAVGDYADVWVPTVGVVETLTFDGAEGETLRRSAFMNEDTQTVIVPGGIATGVRYRLETVIPATPSAKALEDAAFANVTAPRQVNVPAGFAELAAKVTVEAETPLEQVQALQTMLIADGYFSHGLTDSASLPGHGAARLQTFLESETIIGDDEQYAVAMALLADQLGIPTRVVLGWHASPDQPAATGDFVADGSNLHAWVEIAFEGFGWVPFDVTPPEDKEPQDDSQAPQTDQKPQVLQPPPPPQEPADLPPSVADDRDEEEDEEKEDEESATVPWTVLLIGAAGLLVLLGPALVILAAKVLRRHRRRRAPVAADRISGAWDEVVDRAVDLRVPVTAGATRAETAQALETAFPNGSIRALAATADSSVFGPTEPGEEAISAFWRDAEDAMDRMGRTADPWSRLRAKISVRSLVGRRGRQEHRPYGQSKDQAGGVNMP